MIIKIIDHKDYLLFEDGQKDLFKVLRSIQTLCKQSGVCTIAKAHSKEDLLLSTNDSFDRFALVDHLARVSGAIKVDKDPNIKSQYWVIRLQSGVYKSLD
jgi:hypothetical protein